MRIRTRLSALVVASTFALVGCGSDGGGSDDGIADLSADKILAAAEKQLAKEDFVTIEGKGTDAESDSEIEVDLAFAGETASGSVGVSGMQLELLKADGKSYFKADKAFFESTGAPAEAMNLIGDKWVLIDPNNQSFAALGNFVSKDKFVEELLDPEGKVTKGKEKKVNGVDCVALNDGEGTLYVDKEDGKPVSLVSGDAEGEGTLNFSYDKVDEATAPSSDEVVDLASLGS
ncbi:hypothetical protein [Aeromicrobium sp.]|uniref:hypothetical protein n=1 Tax=Aeromicrobium sp. TaxID=1871063 RepID=UPI002FC8EA41